MLEGPAVRSRGASVYFNANQKVRHTMNKRQLIDEIRKYNTTAQPQFLSQFDENALKQYLNHLEGAARKEARIAGFTRRQPGNLRMVS